LQTNKQKNSFTYIVSRSPIYTYSSPHLHVLLTNLHVLVTNLHDLAKLAKAEGIELEPMHRNTILWFYVVKKASVIWTFKDMPVANTYSCIKICP